MVRRWLAGWVMLGVVMAACGGGGGDAPASSSSATSLPGEATGGAPQATDAAGGFTPLAPGEGVTVSPAGAEVSSDDGRLVLTFPAGAVPEDTVVAVEALAADAWPEAIDGLDPAAVVYRLEPSGLTFDQPVPFALTMDLATTDDGFFAPPLALLVDGDGGLEPVGLNVEVDPEAGTAIVTGAVEHFSWIVAHNGALAVGLEQISPKERHLAEPWEADVEVRNVGVSNGGLDLTIRVNTVVFEGLGAVEVEGSESHPGFPLDRGASKKLDFPVPRWQCVDFGQGQYRVVVRADLAGSLLSFVSSSAAKTLNFARDINVLVEKLATETSTDFAVVVGAKVNCKLLLFSASGGGQNLSVSGKVDITQQFTLKGDIVGGKLTMTFLPGDAGVILDFDTGRIGSVGTFAYTGGNGTDVTMVGSGTYTIRGQVGQPLTLHHKGEGCVFPADICRKTEGDITLTPVR